MPKIIFKINDINQEKILVESLQKSIDFFNSHRIETTWPKEEIEKEYKESDYTNFRNKLEEEWSTRENNFFDKIETFFNLKIDEPFEVNISNYGVGGCYNLPRKVIINRQLPYDHISNIKHEIIHLLIEPYIKKYNIDFQNKEKLTNCFLELFC
jgi:hypothetical protein